MMNTDDERLNQLGEMDRYVTLLNSVNHLVLKCGFFPLFLLVLYVALTVVEECPS